MGEEGGEDVARLGAEVGEGGGWAVVDKGCEGCEEVAEGEGGGVAVYY